MRTLYSSLLFALPAFATTTVVSITATAMQAVISVSTDQSGACSYRASQSSTFSPLVHDIDTTLFRDSNLDLRDGSVINGGYHTFVLGKRDSEVAADGSHYSRALRSNTGHSIGVTCGSDPEIVKTFQTQNPPLGRTDSESPPFDKSAFGNYAWPSIDFADQSKSYIDPMTGIEIVRLSAPGMGGIDYQNQVFGAAFDLNSAWAKPDNIRTWPGTGTTQATYSGAASDPLFVALDLTIIPSYALSPSGWVPFNTLDDIMVRTYGSAKSTTWSNNVVRACLSLDSGHTCSTPELSIALPSALGIGPTAPRSGFPISAFGSWSGLHAFHGREFGTVVTTVTTSGHTLTNTGNRSGQYFTSAWKAGGKVLVNGAEIYTITAVVNSMTLIVAEVVSAHSSAVSFKSMCAGVRLRKQTAIGSVSLSVGFDAATSAEFQMPLLGTKTICSQLTSPVTVDAAGKPAATRQARLCTLPMASGFGHALIAFFSDTGETRWLSNFHAYAGEQYHAPDWMIYDYNHPANTGYTGSDCWNPTVPTRLYTSITLQGHPVLVQVDYTGNFSGYKPWPSTNGYSTDTSFPDDKLTYRVVGGYPSDSPARGVDQQATALKNPYFDSTRWTLWSFLGLLPGGVAQWEVTTDKGGGNAGQESPVFFALQDVASGNVTKIIDTIGTYPLRFWGNHSTQELGGNLMLIANILGNKGVDATNYLGGWFTLYPTQIQQGGVWSSNTSITATYADTCPTNISTQWQALGATGLNCILVQAKQPCSDYAGAAERANFPCPWDSSKSMVSILAAGDRFWPDYPPAPGSAETMRVVTTPVDLGKGEVQFWALRHSENYGNLGGAMGSSTAAHADGWRAVMIQPEGRGNAMAAITPSGMIYSETSAVSSTHSAEGVGISLGHYTTVMNGVDPTTGSPLGYPAWGIRWNLSGVSQFNARANYNLYMPGRFSGQDFGGGAMESYTSMQQNQAPITEKNWFLDLHHMNPPTGVGQEVYSAIGSVVASQVTGASNVYRFTSYPGINTNIKLFPVISFAGYHLLSDISGPSSTITDTNEYAFCFAYAAGECQPGSSIGNAYTSVPNGDTEGFKDGQCIGGWYAQSNPCVIIPRVSAAWGVQVDASRPSIGDNYWRKLTQGFSGIGRQYQFGNLNAEPDGQWAFMQCYWCDGIRNEILGVHLPPFPEYDSINRADFVPVTVQIPQPTGQPTYQMKFGYAENGPSSSFFCTSRKEACVTDAVAAPFAFAYSDPRTPAKCPGGCVIQVPGISGRVLYYQVDWLDNLGNVISSEPMNATVVP
jgi:hypothetical protein